ncbi:MAG: DNA (cytosine-5-)-methyltransferase [Lentimicrobiaceae bacterium]|nr:DNA (cytosine-5-)-methyltransferase [Lentimicrobiaceae bacterium]
MARLKVASLFCGCGGMDLGMLGGFSFLDTTYPRSAFDIVYAVDNDEYCTKIYNANFEHKCIIKDVRKIKPSQLPDFDVLIGGFPCQSFSVSAQNPPRLGYKDERGMLFFEMVKILKEKRPRAFIAENVKGLLSANNKKAFPMILNEFSDAGYDVQCFLVNASKFGVPQKRERVIIIGFRDNIDRDNFIFSHYIPYSSVLGDVVEEAENTNESLFFSDRAVAGMMAVRDKMNKGRVQDLSKPCNTISAHLAKVSLNSTDPVLMVGERYRRFSCREAARIQSFPDTFRLDIVSPNRQYKAIGNAVPPVMMWHIANSLQRTFEVTDGDYDAESEKASPMYAFPDYNYLQGTLFEQAATYGS